MHTEQQPYNQELIDEIAGREFSRAFRGYDAAEVDLFLDGVCRALRREAREHELLMLRLDLLTEALEHYGIHLLPEDGKIEETFADAALDEPDLDGLDFDESDLDEPDLDEPEFDEPEFEESEIEESERTEETFADIEDAAPGGAAEEPAENTEETL